MSSKKKSGHSSVGMGSVDVHCHVFNAQDAPVRKFVGRRLKGAAV
jgi:hypothetical protein